MTVPSTPRRARLALLALGTLALPLLGAVRQPAAVASPRAHGAAIEPGSYVAVLANGQKLPWTTQVPAVNGLVHWARLDLAVLRLTPDGRFTLSYRYAQEVVDARAPLRMPPARDELTVGRYSGRGKALTFVATPARVRATRAARPARPITAEIVGGDIFLDKTVFVGERPFRVRLLFKRDPSLW